MSRVRIVIAEDNILIQEAIRIHLAVEFDVVATVEDGHHALTAVSQHQPDVLLLDGSLPGMNGFAVARSVRQSSPAIKIIFVSAESSKTYREEALRAGASGYVLKSNMILELRQAIRNVVSNETQV